MPTILLVETLDGDAAVLASALRVEGFDVEIATTAAQARTILARTDVTIAIVDLMLRAETIPPQSQSQSSELGTTRNGLELARELRERYPSLRVLLTSSYHLSERQLERADCGVSGFIPKPYDLHEVVEFIRVKSSGPPSSRRIWVGEHSSGVRDLGIRDLKGGALETEEERVSKRR